jgi:protein-S-isoprenylcysteine O-methyltransferase Ste14
VGFRIAFFSLFIAMMAIRAYFGRQVRRARGGRRSVSQEAIAREGRWSLVLRGFLFVYMMAAVILYAFNPAWLERFAIPLPAWARWLGVGLSLVGLPLLTWVHHMLGKQWFTDLQMGEGHALITEGPYRWVRHPMYTALFGVFIGLALVSANWLVVLLTGASITVLCARIGKEEAMMVEQFGDAYRAYARRTGRLLPRLCFRCGLPRK